MTTGDNRDLNRRTVLKGVTISVGALAGVPGTGVAARTEITPEDVADLEAPHGSVDGVVRTVEDHASELMETLADRGILPASSVGSLGVDSLLTRDEHVDGREGLYSSVTMLDRPTSRVTLRKYVDDRVVKVFVHPEAGEHYAIVHAQDSRSDVTIVRPEDRDVGTQDDTCCGGGGGGDYVGTSCEADPYTSCTYDEYPWYADSSGCWKGDKWGCCDSYSPPPC